MQKQRVLLLDSIHEPNLTQVTAQPKGNFLGLPPVSFFSCSQNTYSLKEVEFYRLNSVLTEQDIFRQSDLLDDDLKSFGRKLTSFLIRNDSGNNLLRYACPHI